MISITPAVLTRVEDRETLFAFLRDELGWPLDPEDTFTYDEPLLNGTMPKVKVSRLLPFGAGDPFLLLLAEWETPLHRSELREILRAVRARIRKEGAYGSRKLDEIVFVCPAQDYHAVWFAHFEEQDGRQPKLEAFGWDADRINATRTLREVNLPALAMPKLNLLDEPDWATGYHRWLSAWDVESVTRAFFKDYRLVFDRVRESLPTAFTGDPNLWTQRLFNRLLFIHFLSQKREGWLRFAGRKDYLQALWEDYNTKGGNEVNFYQTRLRPLFFTGLNNKHARSLQKDNPTLHNLIGDVPYLNGGLFEKTADDDMVEIVPDAALASVMALFGQYRFTITESTPDDVEVAVDPEMLGKVFEELVTGRHESGSYYTPRSVVAFMCREALKGYLGGGAVTATLVDERSADTLTRKDVADLLRKLAEVRVVDPACGSGAYLLGMLHELYELTGLLELRADALSVQDQYKRKLGIIQNALYGVDLDPFAVNVARLRLWLSLAVEHTGAVPEPLPNLDFKVEVGDSLAVPLPQNGLTGDIFRQAQLDDYKRLKEEYGSPYCAGDRNQLDVQIKTLKRELAAWAHPQQKGKEEPLSGFDWQIEFAEVFTSPAQVADIGGAMNFGGTLAELPARGGFDIIVMNPPYLSASRVPADKRDAFAQYMNMLKSVYGFKNDLYIHFFFRALQLLKFGGILCAITSSTYMTNPTKEFLRRKMLFGSLKWIIPLNKGVFNAEVYSAIAIIQNKPAESTDRMGYLDLRKSEVNGIALAASRFSTASYLPQQEYIEAFSALFFDPTEQNRRIFALIKSARISALSKMPNFIPLGQVAPAMDTGIHSGNVRSKLFFVVEPEGKKLPKLIQGSQVVRYGTWWASPQSRFRYVDTTYVSDESQNGIGRGGKMSASKQYWHFCGSIENHHVTERLLMRQTEDEPFVGYLFQGKEEIYTDNTLHTLLLTDKGRELGLTYFYLLAILNSAPFGVLYHAVAQEEGRTLAQVKTGMVNSLPIPVPGAETRATLEAFVKEIHRNYQLFGFPLSEQTQLEVNNIQQKIDTMVHTLYQL